ncbi:MAG: tetratricopeptide repeat protein [Nitrospinae bacterium]|nr:tetratricopeptide repeat protein [Nitrospinota bacterium]
MQTKGITGQLLGWLLLAVLCVGVGIPPLEAAEQRSAKKLAIVPFTLPTAREERGWLSEGMPRVLALRLERLPRIQVSVLPRTDPSGPSGLRNPLDSTEAAAFLERIRPQGYDAVLVGSFLQIDATLRLEVHLWSTQPDRRLGELVEQASEKDPDGLSIKLAAFVGATLQPSPPEAEWRRLEERLTPSAEAFERFARGLTLAKVPGGEEDVSRAANLFKEALSLDGKFSTTLRQLADLYLQHGQYASAVEAYQNLLSLVKRDASVYRLLGSAYVAQGDANRALGAFKRGVQIDSHDPLLHFDLGLTYAALKDYDNATKELLRTLEFQPDDPLAFANLGVIYLLQGKFAAAISSLRRAQLLHASDPLVAYNLGLALSFERAPDQARDQFQRALQLQPDFAPAAYQLALLQERIDVSQAAERWKKYLELARGKPGEEGWIALAQEHLKRLQAP